MICIWCGRWVILILSQNNAKIWLFHMLKSLIRMIPRKAFFFLVCLCCWIEQNKSYFWNWHFLNLIWINNLWSFEIDQWFLIPYPCSTLSWLSETKHNWFQFRTKKLFEVICVEIDLLPVVCRNTRMKKKMKQLSVWFVDFAGVSFVYIMFRGRTLGSMTPVSRMM